jgi:hypothetical protein
MMASLHIALGKMFHGSSTAVSEALIASTDDRLFASRENGQEENLDSSLPLPRCFPSAAPRFGQQFKDSGHDRRPVFDPQQLDTFRRPVA